ncbi:hypothetical protein THAOC_13431 [Thalassiosira oceanica]|uniref:Uncharacterized protein n=1 Tax=Thalassiosira oceanica TaxID=159749 RepID=K0T5R0_THAOC|nr:hypothetical protein THAOC_13431 [Thalassiosira oceanica]|eukprot:EJK65687.1 hypothetical protein THAOC_13431 [Thalassiosira oceanica]
MWFPGPTTSRLLQSRHSPVPSVRAPAGLFISREGKVEALNDQGRTTNPHRHFFSTKRKHEVEVPDRLTKWPIRNPRPGDHGTGHRTAREGPQGEHLSKIRQRPPTKSDLPRSRCSRSRGDAVEGMKRRDSRNRLAEEKKNSRHRDIDSGEGRRPVALRPCAVRRPGTASSVHRPPAEPVSHVPHAETLPLVLPPADDTEPLVLRTRSADLTVRPGTEWVLEDESLPAARGVRPPTSDDPLPAPARGPSRRTSRRQNARNAAAAQQQAEIPRSVQLDSSKRKRSRMDVRGWIGDAPPSSSGRRKNTYVVNDERSDKATRAVLNRMPDRVDGDEGGVDAAASRDEADRADESAGDEAEADREIAAASGLTSIFQKGTPNATKSGSIAVLLLLLLLLLVGHVEGLVVSPGRRAVRARVGGTALYGGVVAEPIEVPKFAGAAPIGEAPELTGAALIDDGLYPADSVMGVVGFFPCLEILSSLALGRSTLPFATQGSHIDVPPGMYARLLGLHILGMTSLPVLGSMMWPHLHGVAQKVSFLISALLGATGSLSEVRAHFLDSWVFEDGCEAHEGDFERRVHRRPDRRVRLPGGGGVLPGALELCSRRFLRRLPAVPRGRQTLEGV